MTPKLTIEISYVSEDWIAVRAVQTSFDGREITVSETGGRKPEQVVLLVNGILATLYDR